MTLYQSKHTLYAVHRSPELWNHQHTAGWLPGYCGNLCILYRGLVRVLIGKRISVPFGNVSLLGLTDDSMRGETTSLYLFRLKDDHVTLLWWPCHFSRDSDEAITGVQRGRHTAGFDEREEDRLSEYLTDDEDADEEEQGQFRASRDSSDTRHSFYVIGTAD
jgi:hypothetical protein